MRTSTPAAVVRVLGQGRAAASVGLAGAAAVAVLLTVAVVTGSQAVMSFDEGVWRFTETWAQGWPRTLANLVGIAASPLFSTGYAAVAVVVLVRGGRRAAALLVACSAGIGVLLTESLKYAVARTRPPGAGAFVTDVHVSFPSGHASAGIYLFLLLGLVLIRLGRASDAGTMTVAGWLLVGLGPLVGVSRVVLGVHWASDVAGGWAVGSVAALSAALALWRPLEDGWSARRTPSRTGADPGPGTTDGPVPGGEREPGRR